MSLMLGTELSKLCAEARNEILLVAPFIKAPVLERLLTEISLDVSLKCSVLPVGFPMK
ncbi:hypothetical protein [Xenococcus sp. PCC 7305]|uniref:hypothetical protein n=1 Tax=Xenococcus sp. PCC 7305 TaxID=102125 RepID=UPI00130EB6D4|nr:hypothetical protein [Xenococcus sp. PCC 7305]